MSHGGHTADSGPSSRSSAGATGTGMSEETASFVAAHCSPFTNPDDLIPSGPRVPDPQTTQRTCTASIYANFQIPVAPDAYDADGLGPGATATQGKQFITVMANPFSPGVPIYWIQHQTPNRALDQTLTDKCYNGTQHNETPGATNDPDSRKNTACDPISWGQQYDKVGLADLISKIYTLGQLSNKHRIVGCAVKANTGTDATLARGQIEAGQFELSEQRKGIMPPNRVFQTAANGAWAFIDCEKVAQDTSRVSFQTIGSRFMSTVYNDHRNAVWSARNDSRGILSAVDGACVRWTDSNSFKFQQTVNKCVLVPDLDFYDNGEEGDRGTAEESTDAGTGAERTVWDITYINCNASRRNRVITGQRSQLNAIQRWFNGPLNAPTQAEYFTADRSDRTLFGTQPALVGYNGYSAGPPVTYTSQPVLPASPTVVSLNNTEGDFDRGLYIDITGVAPNQMVNVEVQWFIEYIPKVYSLMVGRNPPIDMNFPAIQAMVQDSKTYPIVVKGHSFFNSLWHAIKRGAEGAGKLLSGTSKIAALIPDPRAQALAGVTGAAGGVFGGLARL